MYGPPFTTNEIGAKLGRQIAELQGLGVQRDRAVMEVAKRHRISPQIVHRLTVSQRDEATASGAAA